MPEIAEVETVRNTLKLRILNQKIKKVKVHYQSIIMSEGKEIEKIVGETFTDILRIGKWLLFETENYYLLSHLRMEGKFFIKNESDPLEKHEHIEIIFENGLDLRYHDTRKFGRMLLILKENLYEFEGIKKQGIEPIDDSLTKEYLYDRLKKKRLPMKTLLLDQTIISGLGNIYANEVLFAAQISPFKKGNEITIEECERVVKSSKEIIEKAIEMGGTTIRSYTSSLGVTGRFQQYLMVHNKENENCQKCGTKIERQPIGGRSTYYCRKCQHVD